jgi:hypothetical protein
MFQKRLIAVLTVAAVLACVALPAFAQSQEKYKVRLAPVPALNIQAATIQGIGSASAVLTGRKLTITGSYEKLASPATAAHLFIGSLTGVRGEQLYDLTVSKGTSGTITGSVDLTPQQVDALKKGRLYIQLHSEGAPNGHLMGWLLK